MKNLKYNILALFFFAVCPSVAVYAIDQCNNTNECKRTYGMTATDCKGSKTPNSVCICGLNRCDVKSSLPSLSKVKTNSNTNVGVVDQCNNTRQCKAKYGSGATDCRNSKAFNSVCFCGSGRCDIFTQPEPKPEPEPKPNSGKISAPDGFNGLSGYISYSTEEQPDGFNVGAGFYSAVWPLSPKPLSNFQIGLPGTWIIPDNRDNRAIPLCPVGTVARDNWPERAPTYRDVFQTLEGGLGYWAGNRFRYGPPKFSLNATPDCYTHEIASPGWEFFRSSKQLPDNMLGVIQLSNRLMIPPDGLPFQGYPNGELMGYTWMALPFTEPNLGDWQTGNLSWTLFLSSNNFKGPVAYYLPETWSKVAKTYNYQFAYEKGLDTRPGLMNDGAMELNTVPFFRGQASDGTVYSKIPQLQFPFDSEGRSLLVRDVHFYSKDALYNAVDAWRKGGAVPSGKFSSQGIFRSKLTTNSANYRQENIPLDRVDNIIDTQIYSDYGWGLEWKDNSITERGLFPQYFKQEGNKRVPVPESSVPDETGLKNKLFPLARPGGSYEVDIKGAWAVPGPASGPFKAKLADGSTVTYYWYRFIDQPGFQQYNWRPANKERLQTMVEKLHREWPINKEYIPVPTNGELVNLDPALIVTPPKGYEYGYVPIVVAQGVK